MSHWTGRRHRRHQTGRRRGRLLRLALFAALVVVGLRRLRDRHELHEHFAGAHHGHAMDPHYD